MLIEGSIRSNKTQILIDEYVNLLDKGVKPEEILVITLNSYKKQDFIEKVKKKTQSETITKPNIHTFYGLCYNAISDNWPIVEEQINIGIPKVLPNLCGLETSQYIMKLAVRKVGFKDYLSKINLLHQLFRRYSLTLQNMLSDEEVEKRSKILKETFSEDSKKALDNYKLITLEKRSFDYLRQLSIFPYIYSNTDYFSQIKYLFIDDADEITYANWKFIEHIGKQLKDVYIAYDTIGGSRCGYLSAYKTGVFQFEKLFNQNAKKLDSNDTISQDAHNLFTNMQAGKKTQIKHMNFCEKNKRLEMIDSALTEIKKQISHGEKAQNLCIVTPIIDDSLRFYLEESLKKEEIKYQIISGSEKLADSNIIKTALTIVKLVNQDWNIKIEQHEIKSIFRNLLNIPIKYSIGIIKLFEENGILPEYEFKNPEHNKKYNNLVNILKSITKDKISAQLLFIYEKFLYKKASKLDTKKYSFLLKEVNDFEKAFNEQTEQLKKEFILQLENSIISENPATATQIEENSIIVSTPQKIIDFEIKTKHQFWLDTTSIEWQKQDIGPLYNSWVFNADWNKEEFTYEDNLRLTQEKTARMLRKLILCSEELIYCYSSLYDSLGNENNGFDYFIRNEVIRTSNKPGQITPREDQKPVLEYKEGLMGIMAVPGAGKTTILLALISKLIDRGIKSANIFVLTYMESAARNFKERLRDYYSNKVELPNISTIHGLALKILKENSNYSKLNLDADFEICDDNERQKIIREVLSRLNIEQDEYEKYEKGISTIKLCLVPLNQKSQHKEINSFVDFYNDYNKELRKNNLIDYDDMLALSVELLEKNPDVLDYYQDICRYIIEDEAQDSSRLQQHLLKLLSGKYNNLIRCGDVNQSITTTFTNTDIKDFINFIDKSNCVKMDSSQRCTESIYTLANKLVDITQDYMETENAFYAIQMKPTASNPTTTKVPEFKEFENENDEKTFIIKLLQNLLTKNPNKSIGILLRQNYQVNDYNEFLSKYGFKTITRTDCLGQRSIFKLIFAIIKLTNKPLNNSFVIETMQAFQENNIFSYTTNDYEEIKKLNSPFISFEKNSDNLDSFKWEMDYWLNFSYLPINELALKIGLYYFKTEVARSNTYLISTIIKRLLNNYKTTENTIEKLSYMADQPLKSNYNFFEDEEENNYSKEGKISIMTMHKSKGDEFDIVLIPELTEELYSTNFASVKTKAKSIFFESIKSLNKNYTRKSPEDIKKEQIEETLRLLYVGITRAKEELYLSYSKSYRRRKKTTPCKIISKLMEDKK